MTATAGSDVVQSGRPIFDDFFQHVCAVLLEPQLLDIMIVQFRNEKVEWLIQVKPVDAKTHFVGQGSSRRGCKGVSAQVSSRSFDLGSNLQRRITMTIQIVDPTMHS
ncbi:hypothetical protein TNCV_4173801 [Trichonephila clavipes]|nr:hypothetical protein TNCV_4173801 [Trichonephila clavipes]